MLSRLVPIGLAVAGIVNLLPVVGVLGASWLKSLYGFDVAGADLEILLRHRAVLFGILGVLLLTAVLRPVLRGPAFIMAFASMASFICIAFVVGNFGEPIRKIIIADIIGLIALVPAALARFSASSHKPG